MSRINRKFSAEFKSKVALEAIKGLKSISEIAHEYELHPVQVTQWKKDALERFSDLFEGDKKQKEQISKMQSEREELFQQIGQMSVELEWLKKKLK